MSKFVSYRHTIVTFSDKTAADTYCDMLSAMKRIGLIEEAYHYTATTRNLGPGGLRAPNFEVIEIWICITDVKE